MVLLGAIDQGTSSSRFLVFDSDTGDLVTSHQIDVNQLYPEPGWVEMDPNEIYTTVVDCIDHACAKLSEMGIRNPCDEIKAVGISNQRETTIVWDKNTGEPLYNAIVWLDTRTSDLAQKLVQKLPNGDFNHFKRKTGLPIHPYFSSLKLKWLLENVSAVQTALHEGSLLFGTVDSWLLWKLTGVHVTDVTNASRTFLLDLHKVKWSSELCTFFQIPMNILPSIKSSAEVYGKIKTGSLRGTPIAGCLGDQQSALVGHNCFKAGEAKNTYGTGTFMLCNTGPQIIQSKCGLLATVAFQFGTGSPVCYALEGSGSFGGNVVQFLRDNLGFIQKSDDVEILASSVDTTEDVYFVPCFTGLFTPYWDSTARGTIIGLTQRTTRAHICLAALKSVAFQTAEMIEAVEHDLEGHAAVRTLKIDGGMTRNVLFNQIQSDALGRQIICSKMAEISGWGAAVAAGVGTKHICLDDHNANVNQKMVAYNPKNASETREAELLRWKEAVGRARNWALS